MSLTGTAEAKQVLRGKLTNIPRIDTTLTNEGECAEAKATGEALSDLRADLNNAIVESASKIQSSMDNYWQMLESSNSVANATVE